MATVPFDPDTTPVRRDERRRAPGSTPYLVPSLAVGEPIAIATVSGVGVLPLNGTNYSAVVNEHLVVVYAQDSDRIEVVRIPIDLLELAADEAFRITETIDVGGRVVTPTITRARRLRPRHTEIDDGPFEAFVAATVGPPGSAHIHLWGRRTSIVFGSDLGSRPVWHDLGVISGSIERCAYPSIACNQASTDGSLFCVFQQEPADPESGDPPIVYAVKTRADGTVTHGPTRVGTGALPSVAAHDGHMVIAWKELRERRVVAIDWDSDGTWPVESVESFGEPTIVAGSGGFDPTDHAKDCSVAVTDDGDFWLVYDKTPEVHGSDAERVVGVAQFAHGAGWRSDAVALETRSGTGEGYRGMEYATGRGGSIGSHRVIAWEARLGIPEERYSVNVGYALETGPSTGTWSLGGAITSESIDDLLFPEFVTWDDQGSLLTIQGTAMPGSISGTLVVWPCRLAYGSR